MKKSFFSKKIWLSIVACLLVCVMTFEDVPAFIMEASYEPTYISDLCMFYDADFTNMKISVFFSCATEKNRSRDLLIGGMPPLTN